MPASHACEVLRGAFGSQALERGEGSVTAAVRCLASLWLLHAQGHPSKELHALATPPALQHRTPLVRRCRHLQGGDSDHLDLRRRVMEFIEGRADEYRLFMYVCVAWCWFSVGGERPLIDCRGCVGGLVGRRAEECRLFMRVVLLCGYHHPNTMSHLPICRSASLPLI